MGDALLPCPFVRRALLLLQHFSAPPDRYACVLGLDGEGRVAQSLQDPEGQSYGGITTAVECEGRLYLGHVDEPTVGRVALDQ